MYIDGLYLLVQLYLSCVRSTYQRSAFKLMLMLFSFMLALLVGLSRISDNKHHPTDVLSGWIIGGAVAFVVVSQLPLHHRYEDYYASKRSHTTNT